MSDSFHRQVLDSLADPIAVLDPQGVIELVNAAWWHFAWGNGCLQGTISPIGINYLSICSQAAGANGEEGPLAADGIRAVMAGRQTEYHLDYPCHSPTEQRWFRMSVMRLNGSASQVVISHRNITQHKRTEIAAKLAHTMLRRAREEDSLTGLPNRTVLMQRLEELAQRCRVQPSFRFAVLFLEIDRFKLLSDTLGHRAGDEMLMSIGQRLLDAEATDSFVAHFGDDVFVYLACGIEGVTEAAAIADHLRELLSAPFSVLGYDLRSSISIGIAMGGAGFDFHELLRNGTIALHEAGQTALGATVLYDQTMHQRLMRRLRLAVACGIDRADG